MPPRPRSCLYIPGLPRGSHSPAAAWFGVCTARVYVLCVLPPPPLPPSGPPNSRGLYSSSAHRPLLLGPKGFRPWRSWEFSAAMGTLNMSGRLLHARPLQVLGLLPAAARRRLISGMRSLGVLVGMLHPFGGVPLPSTRGWDSTPWCRGFLGMRITESHTAGADGWPMRPGPVHP